MMNTGSFTNMLKVTWLQPSQLVSFIRTHDSHSLDAFVVESVPSSSSTQETLRITLWLQQTSLPVELRICDLVSFLDVCSLRKQAHKQFL